jgi:Copper transport outer membrane protein, MctB
VGPAHVGVDAAAGVQDHPLISFRQHLVTIVAIFLALGIGVLMGTTVVKQGLIGQLKKSAERQATAAQSLRKQVAQLETQIRTQGRFISAVEPMLVKDQLSGTSVVIVTIDGVDPSAVDGVRTALEDSGASVVAVVVATTRMALTDPNARQQLSTVLGTSTATAAPARLAGLAAEALGARLADGQEASGASDLIAQLTADRFLAIRSGTTSDPTQIGGTTQSVVVLAGNAGAPASFDPRSFLTPLLTSVLAADPSRPVVAAETTGSLSPYLASVRADQTLDSHLVTVDDADTVAGQVAVVLGLHDLQLSPGDGGDYGVSCGSCQPVPSPAP